MLHRSGEKKQEFRQTRCLSPPPLELDLASSTGSSTSEGSKFTVTSNGGLVGAIGRAVKRYQRCKTCGESSEKTQHCVHCGLILCDRDRNQHIKEVVESLKELKKSSNRSVKRANDKKERIGQTIISTEQSRQVAKQKIQDEFRQLTCVLNARKQQILEQLDSFGRDELLLLNEDKITLDQHVKALRSVESEFRPRLAQYSGMTDSTFAKICQAKIDYQDCLSWIDLALEKDDSFIPIVFEPTPGFKESWGCYGSIGYGKTSRLIPRRKSLTNLTLPNGEPSNEANGMRQPCDIDRPPVVNLCRSTSFGSAKFLASRNSLSSKSQENLKKPWISSDKFYHPERDTF